MGCRRTAFSQSLRLIGDPVDVVTGANIDSTRDLELHGPIVLTWRRYYDSSQNTWLRALGWGHTHAYDRQLLYDLDGMRYIDPAGTSIAFPPVEEGASAASDGYRLSRVEAHTFRLWSPDEAAIMEFSFHDENRPARLHRLIQGNHTIEFHYGRAGFLTRIIDSCGRRIAVEHDDAGRVLALVRLETEGKKKEALLRYAYDERGNLVKGIDQYGHAFGFEYDDSNHIIRRTDRRGYSFLFRYDARGRCVYTSGEDGLYEASLTYEPNIRKTTVIRGDGGKWEYYYNDQSNLTLVIDPYGGALRFNYDDNGRLIEEIDPNGNTTRILYNAAGAPIGKQGPLGQFSTDMDGFGAPDLPPHRIGSCPAEWEYGDLIDWRAITRPTASSSLLGQLPKFVRPLVRTAPAPAGGSDTSLPLAEQPGPQRPNGESRNEQGEIRNEFGLLVRQENEDGRPRRWAYDPSGNVRRYIDHDGSHYTFEHTSWNFRCRETDPLGHAVTYEPTPSWQIAAVVDGGGARSEYVYDRKDRLTKVIRHGVVKEEYRYDAADNLIEKLDGDGRTLLSFEIGAANLNKVRRLASGETHSFEYDEKGRYVRAATDDAEVSFAYDAVGNRVADLRDGKGVMHVFEGGALVETTTLGRFKTRYAQREDGGLIITDPTGRQHEIRVLEGGLVHRTMSSGLSEVAQYDSEGRCLLKCLNSASGTWSRQYFYSAEGDLLSVEDSRAGTTRYRYDAAHRLTARILPGGDVQPFHYDAADNLLEKPGLGGVSLREGNRLATANGDRFEYNRRNCISERRSNRGDWRFAYDSRDMLTRIEMPDGIWEARYDPLGRRTRKTFQEQWIDYNWDTDRLAAEVFSDGRTRIYVYPDAFSIVPLLFIDYADADADPASGEVFYPLYDQIGAPILVTDQAGRKVWEAKLEPYGTADIRTGASFYMPLRFPGHYWDAETGLHYNRFRYYSPELGRYLQSDPLGIVDGINLHAYTHNPLVEVDVRGLKKGGCGGDDDSDDQPSTKPDKPDPESSKLPGGVPPTQKKKKKKSARLQYMGRTPSKKSRVGREVIQNMKKEDPPRVRGEGKNQEFMASDGEWYPIKYADMSHTIDAVLWWNTEGYKYGARSPKVREFMLKSEHYELDHFSINRSKGASIGETYSPPAK